MQCMSHFNNALCRGVGRCSKLGAQFILKPIKNGYAKSEISLNKMVGELFISLCLEQNSPLVEAQNVGAQMRNLAH